MGRMPDLTPLFYLAGFGLLCAALAIVLGGGWLGFHLFMALSAYLGAS